MLERVFFYGSLSPSPSSLGGREGGPVVRRGPQVPVLHPGDDLLSGAGHGHALVVSDRRCAGLWSEGSSAVSGDPHVPAVHRADHDAPVGRQGRCLHVDAARQDAGRERPARAAIRRQVKASAGAPRRRRGRGEPRAVRGRRDRVPLGEGEGVGGGGGGGREGGRESGKDTFSWILRRTLCFFLLVASRARSNSLARSFKLLILLTSSGPARWFETKTSQSP